MTSHRRTQKDIIEQLMKKPGLRAKIDAHCVSCVYDEFVPGSWRRQVEECCVISCPLFDSRARSTAKSPAIDPIADEPDLNHSDESLTPENALRGVANTTLCRSQVDNQVCQS